MRKAISILAMFLMYVQILSATAQMPDIIIIDGKECALLGNPLEKYFDSTPDSRPRGGVMSTALWRGYVAVFQVVDGRLYAVDVRVQKVRTGTSSEYEWVSVFKQLFPGTDRFFLEYFSGILVVPRGERVKYVHMGYASEYERYILFEIKKGMEGKVLHLDLEQYIEFKKRQFERFKKTETYRVLRDRMKIENRDMSDGDVDRFLAIFVIEYSTEILEE